MIKYYKDLKPKLKLQNNILNKTEDKQNNKKKHNNY